MNICRLYLRTGKPREVRSVAPGIFECVLSDGAWDNMAGLVEPFCEPEAKGFQWLWDAGGIRLLISRDGRW